jgi:predicted HTH domain antitoxin
MAIREPEIETEQGTMGGVLKVKDVGARRRFSGDTLKPRRQEMAKLTLEVPSEVVDAVKLPPAEIEAELRKELALALYQRGVLSLGKARVLAGMTRWQFEQVLADRHVLRHYTETDLQDDLGYAHGHL